MPTNNGFVVRDFAATFNGVANNTPYLRERNSTVGGRYPTSYCLVTPPGVNSFTAGDKIEFIAKAIIFPKQIVDYYGPNQNFIDALTTYGNSWEMLYREASHNAINATSQNNVVDLKYPLSVQTLNNTADVTITGGTRRIH